MLYCALAKGMTSRPRPTQIPQADEAAPGCGMLLLQAEQNGKRLAASWLGGEDGRLARGQGSETGETTGGTARCEPLPVLVISGASNPQRYGPVHACLRVVAAKSEAVCARKMPSPTFVSLGLTFWRGRLDDVRSWGLTRLVSRPYPLRESCQIPHSAAAHLGTLQGVTARWVIAALPTIGSKLGVVQPQSGDWAASSGPLRPSVGP